MIIKSLVMTFDVGNHWSSTLYVAPFYVCISAPDHSVQIEMGMSLRHCTQDTFVSGQPCKSLFATQCSYQGDPSLNFEAPGIVYAYGWRCGGYFLNVHPHTCSKCPGTVLCHLTLTDFNVATTMHNKEVSSQWRSQDFAN